MRRFEFMIPVGTKHLSLSYGKVTFKDSLCFIPSPLGNFPATFGITELKKGFFPHLFHTEEHLDYVGPLPASEYYQPDHMSPKKKEEFEGK